MDTLSASVARALGDRQEESVAAQAIVTAEVERFRTASRQRGAAPIIAVVAGPRSSRCASPSWSGTGPSWPT